MLLHCYSWRADDTFGPAGRDDEFFEPLLDHVGLFFHARGSVGFVEQRERLFVLLEFDGDFQFLQHQLGVAELFLNFGVGDVTGCQIVFEFERLLERDGRFFIIFRFVVNQAEVVQARRRGFYGAGDFETVDGVAIFLLLGVENAEPVVGGGVAFIDFQDGKQCFFGAQETAFTHALVRDVPQFAQPVADFARHAGVFVVVHGRVEVREQSEAGQNQQLKHDVVYYIKV